MPNKIKIRILKKIDEKKKKDPVSDEISKLVKKGTPHKASGRYCFIDGRRRQT